MSVYKGDNLIAGSGLDVEYIRNQNILSDWEDLTISFEEYIVPYDGYVAFETGAFVGSGNVGCIRVNGVLCNSWGYVTQNVAITANTQGSSALVKKGDVITIFGNVNTIKARYYKLRDYTGR